MRLATKINIYATLLFATLVILVACATRMHLARVYRGETRSWLARCEQGYRLAIEDLCREQMAAAMRQSRRGALASAAARRDREALRSYLRSTQVELEPDYLQVLDARGDLLADGSGAGPAGTNVVTLPESTIGDGGSFLTRQGGELALLTAVPLEHLDRRVGYVCIGKRFDRPYLDRLSSMLGGEIVFCSPDEYLAGTVPAIRPPRDLAAALAGTGKPVFVEGLGLGRERYDFIFFPTASAPPEIILAGLGRNRRAVAAGLARSRSFVILLSLTGLALSLAGSRLLARSIKRSLFDQEPEQIAAALHERAAILQSMAEGVITVDRAGIITSINPEVRRLWSREAAIVGRELAELLPDADQARVLDGGTALYNQQCFLGEANLSYNMVPVKAQQGVIGAVVTLRDQTDLQRAATELAELKGYAQALRAQSHEFINKIHTISGLIQLGRYEEALLQLHETAQSHQEFVTFLRRSFPGSNIPGILLGKFNRANELNIQFHLNPRSGITTAAGLPEAALVCAIGNLVENAFDALKSSEQPEKHIWLKIKERGAMLSILVVDNGPGVRREIRRRIFERGFTTKVGQSMGLGLTLVQQYAAALGGAVAVHSDKLTAFLVRIPLAGEGAKDAAD